MLYLFAGSKIKGKNIILINKFLRVISYPINIIHYPLIFLQEAFIFNNPDSSFSNHFFLAMLIFVFSMQLFRQYNIKNKKMEF